MTTILDLAESTNEDEELVPEILLVDARLALRGPVASILSLFERAASVTPDKEIIAGTGHALIEAFAASTSSAAYIKVTATDGDLTVSAVADGITVQMPGAALVPPKKIVGILKLAPTGTAALEVLGNTATVRSGRAQWSVATPVGDSLPPCADVSGIKTHTLLVTPLLAALSIARKAAPVSAGRAALSQLLLRHGAVAAMDGQRMHRQTVENLPYDLDLTIPLRVADEVIRLLRLSVTETVTLGGNSSHLYFKVDEDELIAQRTTTPFPDITNYILGPSLTNQHTLAVNRQDLLESVKRIRINADPEYQTLFLTLMPGKTTSDGTSWNLTVSARDRIGNSARETLPVAWSGPKGNKALTTNHKNLMDLLGVVSDDDIVLRIGDDTKTDKRGLFVENKVTGFTGLVNQVRTGYLT